MPGMQPTEQICTSPMDRGCQNTYLDVPLAYVYRSVLSREQWRMALSALEKLFRLHPRGRRSDWLVGLCDLFY